MQQAMTDIHIQHPDSCASDRCLTAEDSTAPVKMLVPSIQTRVKQSRHRTGLGVHTCNIGALVVIAAIGALLTLPDPKNC